MCVVDKCGDLMRAFLDAAASRDNDVPWKGDKSVEYICALMNDTLRVRDKHLPELMETESEVAQKHELQRGHELTTEHLDSAGAAGAKLLAQITLHQTKVDAMMADLFTPQWGQGRNGEVVV